MTGPDFCWLESVGSVVHHVGFDVSCRDAGMHARHG
jgi:hypothetical protein